MLPLSLWHFQTEKRKENHGHGYAPQGAMGLKLWGSLASKLADSEMRNNFDIMAKALEDRTQEKLTAVNTF